MLQVVDEQLGANTYFAETATDGEVVVVDPGLDLDAILRVLEAESLRPVALVCTHGHFDHIASAHQLQQEFGAPIYLHRDDAKLIRSANFLMMACGIRGHVTVPEVDCFVEDGAQVDVGPDALRFVHTPGHTPGSCVVHYRDSLFTGDTIYRDGVGLVDFPGEDKAQLRASILKVWERFEDNIWARPGHGGAGLFGSLKAENLPLRQFLALGAAQVT